MLVDWTMEGLTSKAKDSHFELLYVPNALVERTWPYVDELLERYPELWNYAHTKESIQRGLETGILQLWVVVEETVPQAAFLTIGIIYPAARILQVVWGVGEHLDKYIQLGLSGLEDYAVENGYQHVEVLGRVGWRKPLGRFGYRYAQTSFIKDVLKGRMN